MTESSSDAPERRGLLRRLSPQRRWRRLLVASAAAAASVVALVLVLPGPASASTLFGSITPEVAAYDDGSAVTIGVQFSTRTAGAVRAIRFYKGEGNDGTHVGGLFDEQGRQLSAGRFTDETESGWQTLQLAAPVGVRAGDVLTAAVFAPQGHYAVETGYEWGRRNDDLVALGGTFAYGSELRYPTASFREANYWVDVDFRTGAVAGPDVEPSPAPAAGASTTSSPVTSPPAPEPTATGARPTIAPAPVQTGTCPAAANTPGGADPWGGCWPGPASTGYPHGLKGDTRTPVSLTPYTGPVTISSCGTVIDSKVVGNIVLQAGNGSHDPAKPCLTIKNSLVKGVIHTDDPKFGPVVVSDTEIDLDGTVGFWENLGRYNVFAYRVDSHGGEGVIRCADYCETRDSYIHGAHLGGSYHYNAFGSNGIEPSDGYFRIDHNFASCGDWEAVSGSVGSDAGCSAVIGFYGDFAPIQNVTINRNYLAGMRLDSSVPAAESRQPGYCLNPGYYPGKPFPAPKGMVVTDNVFGRGDSKKCGVFGPTNSLNEDGNPAGNVWSGNRYADGTAIQRVEE